MKYHSLALLFFRLLGVSIVLYAIYLLLMQSIMALRVQHIIYHAEITSGLRIPSAGSPDPLLTAGFWLFALTAAFGLTIFFLSPLLARLALFGQKE